MIDSRSLDAKQTTSEKFLSHFVKARRSALKWFHYLIVLYLFNFAPCYCGPCLRFEDNFQPLLQIQTISVPFDLEKNHTFINLKFLTGRFYFDMTKFDIVFWKGVNEKETFPCIFFFYINREVNKTSCSVNHCLNHSKSLITYTMPNAL